jgi:hypothetical protein
MLRSSYDACGCSTQTTSIINLKRGTLFLQRLERHDEAAGWWRRYLVLDGSSPWAARAKRALKYCEIQLAGSAS